MFIATIEIKLTIDGVNTKEEALKIASNWKELIKNKEILKETIFISEYPSPILSIEEIQG